MSILSSKSDTTLSYSNTNSEPRSRWALRAIAYLPTAFTFLFIATSAFFLWRARVDAFAAMEERLNSALLLDQVTDLVKTVDITGALAQEALLAKKAVPASNARLLAVDQRKDKLDQLSRTLAQPEHAAANTAFDPHMRRVVKNVEAIDRVAAKSQDAENMATWTAMEQLREEVRHSVQEMNKSARESYDRAVANQVDSARSLQLFERIFFVASGLFLVTLLLTGRSLAKYVAAERSQAALQQSLFDAANQADLKAKQALLDSIQHAQSRYIASGDLVPILDELLTDLLRLTRSDFGFIGELLAGPTTGVKLGARVVKNVGWGAGAQQAGANPAAQKVELRIVEHLIAQVLSSKEPLISNEPPRGAEGSSRRVDVVSLSSFLVLPVLHGSTFVGVVGVGNRPGGYDPKLADFLQPLVSTCGKLFQACANERRQRQADLERQKFVFLVENSSDCIGMATLDGRMFFLNSAGRRLLGLAPEAPIGSTCLWDFYFEGGEKFFHEKLFSSLKSVGRWEGEVLVRNQITLQAVPVFQNVFLVSSDDQAEPLYVAVVNRDITESRRAATALNQAKDQAESASRSKSEFLANMSHEVRTPMVAILGFADMLLDSALNPEERKRAIQDISRNGKHLLQVINDILDLSKIEAGKLTLEYISYSPWQIVLETLSALRTPGEKKRARLEAAPVGKLPRTVLTDPRRVRQILFNLVSNALKFTSPDRRVSIKLVMDEPAKRLCFDVTDEGIGITESQMGRLFHPFEQGDASTTRRFGGTGLGLSISKRLAQMMGGDINAKSTPGEGSRFAFLLPVDPAKVESWVTAQELELEYMGGLAEDRGLIVPACTGRVLLAEDSPDSQRVIRYYLEKAGLQVETAVNGRIAVDMANAAAFDLILMDMQMPEMDGYEAAATLREMGCQSPIIALTAHAMRGDREKCIEAGCDDYLTKPVEPAKLVAAIVRFLPGSQAMLSVSDAKADAGTTPRPSASSHPTMTQTAAPPAGLTVQSIPERIQSGFANDGTMQALIVEYVNGLRQHVTKLRQAIDSGDSHQMISLAHQTKGAGGMYGYPTLSQAAGALEAAARKGMPIKDIKRLWDVLDVVTSAVEKGLNGTEG